MTSDEAPERPNLIIDQGINKMITVASLDVNLAQEIFITTVDKARLCLSQALKNMERRDSWMAPAGILATILGTFLTATFRDFLFSKDTWEAFFVFAALAALLWLVISVVRRPKAASVDQIIEELRRGFLAKGGK